MQLIDKYCFKQAQSIVNEAARHAVALNYDHLIADLYTLSQKLNQLSKLAGEIQLKN